MDEKKSMELNKEQLDKVAGGVWDEENGFAYFEGTVVDMGGRTAFVRIDDLFCEKECGPYPGLYLLGVAVEGAENIEKLQGKIQVEPVS